MRTSVSVVAAISTGPASVSTVISVISGPGEIEETVPNRPSVVWLAGEWEPEAAVIKSINADRARATARLGILKVVLLSEGKAVGAHRRREISAPGRRIGSRYEYDGPYQ